MNGRLRPEPIELGAGEAYRLRFMHTSPDDHEHVEPLAGEEPGELTIHRRDPVEDIGNTRVVLNRCILTHDDLSISRAPVLLRNYRKAASTHRPEPPPESSHGDSHDHAVARTARPSARSGRAHR